MKLIMKLTICHDNTYSLNVLKNRDEHTSTAIHVLILVPHTVRARI